MKISPEGKKLIQHFEGLRLEAYEDGKHWSIGYGHNGPDVTPGMKITKAKASQLFLKDVEWAEEAVERLVKVPLLQNEFDALTSFVYNIGETEFRESTLLRRLNLGERLAAADHILKWVYFKKEVDKGLVKRRGAERKLFLGHDIKTSIEAGDEEYALYKQRVQGS